MQAQIDQILEANVKKEEKWHRISEQEKQQVLAKIKDQFSKLFSRKKQHELS